MKKKLLICASVLASALVSCDSFLDREPLDKICLLYTSTNEEDFNTIPVRIEYTLIFCLYGSS